MMFKRYILLLVLIVMTTSCGLAKFGDVARNVSLEQITSIQLKGFTGIEIKADVANDSSSIVAMESGVIELFEGDKVVATIVQVGRASIDAKSRGEVVTIWKLEGLDAMAMVRLAARISRSEYDDMTIGYSAELMADKRSKKVSGKRVDIAKILSTFAL
ncbi:MAG: hypothetical protein SNG35_06115 [Rikenellaceae bacterium]